MAQITLDLERRGGKRDPETTKKGQRRVEDDNPRETKVRGELEVEGIVIACVWVRLYGGAARYAEGPVHLYGEAAVFFLFFPSLAHKIEKEVNTSNKPSIKQNTLYCLQISSISSFT